MGKRTLHVYSSHARLMKDFRRLGEEPGWAMSTPQMSAQRTDGGELRRFALVTSLHCAHKWAGYEVAEVRFFGDVPEDAQIYLRALVRPPAP